MAGGLAALIGKDEKENREQRSGARPRVSGYLKVEWKKTRSVMELVGVKTQRPE